MASRSAEVGLRKSPKAHECLPASKKTEKRASMARKKPPPDPEVEEELPEEPPAGGAPMGLGCGAPLGALDASTEPTIAGFSPRRRW